MSALTEVSPDPLSGPVGKKHRGRWWPLYVAAIAVAVGGVGWHVSANARQSALNSALLQAIEKRDTYRAIRLLEEGADPDAEKPPPPLGQPWWRRMWGLVRGMPRSRGYEYTRPLFACWNGDIVFEEAGGPTLNVHPDPKLVEALLKHGADPNVTASGIGSPLAAMSEYQEKSCVALLMAHGADPNLPPGKGAPGPPLALAARNYDLEIIRTLLAHHADPNAPDRNGRTPLMNACASWHAPVETLSVLLKAGANPNLPGRDGRTALMLAAMRTMYTPDAQPEKVRALLAAGADPSMRDLNGETALDIARDQGTTEVVGVLERAVAERKGRK